MSERFHPRLVRDALAAHQAPIIQGASDGGALAFTLAQLLTSSPRPTAPWVIVAPDPARAALIEEGLAFFLGPTFTVRLFPAFDHLPFQGMSPSRSHTLDRAGVLTRLAARRAGLPSTPSDALDVLIVPAAALLDLIPPPAFFDAHRLSLAPGDLIDRDALLDLLVASGYHRVPAVEDPGSFAVRGELLDIWPSSTVDPIRISLFDDEIETLTAFDPTTQERHATLPRLTLGPARDLALDAAHAADVRASLFALADTCLVPSSRTRAIAADLDAGILPPGLEELLPLFHPTLTPLSAHLPDATWVLVDPDRIHQTLDERYQNLLERHDRARQKSGELLFPLAALATPAASVSAALVATAPLSFSALVHSDAPVAAPVFRAALEPQRSLRRSLEISIQTNAERPLTPFIDAVHAWREAGAAVILFGHTPGGLERLRALLAAYPLTLRVDPAPTASPLTLAQLRRDPADIHLLLGTPGEGFTALDAGLVIVDETELLSRPPRPRPRRTKPPADAILKSWRDLNPGDLIVHLSHGIGRYLGLRQITLDDSGRTADVLEVAYAGGGVLMVPVDKLHLISKHQGGDAPPALDKLGGAGLAAWQRTKSRVKSAVRDIADKLLKIYAERESAEGFAYSPPDELYHRFEAAFPYQETEDQLTAIDDILRDLMRRRPMDRLLCGDVGFGKTEVAMRAAMKVALDGRQVAVLVPTRLLAEQHRMTFQRRFDGTPIRVESLSAQKATADQREVAAAVRAGSVDILIGTHRLLSKDIQFKDIGLLIIDEEHRFGVAQKERLKEIRANLDVLTLTATPIPRTLHLSMLGIRDISLIQTPPRDRLPVDTFIAQPTEETIREAIQRELARGGQVFFVHHRVADIAKQAELIQSLVPQARVVVGHGQMSERELEAAMLRFVTGEANVLVATTVIESGIDIPNANTILINRADCFGLAQLYQMRGRVGRSERRATCYLLMPSPHTLSSDAAERLGAIQRFSELGSGYSIASYDLDLRGTGDLLGADQAGNIGAIGYDAYMELLQEAIAERRAHDNHAPQEAIAPDCELKIPIDARIPEHWLPETALRLRLYRAFAGAKTAAELAALLGSAVDRYGPPPPELRALSDLMALKLQARTLHLSSISYGKDRLVLGLSPDGPIAPLIAAEFAAKVHRAPGGHLTPEGALILPHPSGPLPSELAYITGILQELQQWTHHFGGPEATKLIRTRSPATPPPPPPERSLSRQEVAALRTAPRRVIGRRRR